MSKVESKGLMPIGNRVNKITRKTNAVNPAKRGALGDAQNKLVRQAACLSLKDAVNVRKPAAGLVKAASKIGVRTRSNNARDKENENIVGPAKKASKIPTKGISNVLLAKQPQEIVAAQNAVKNKPKTILSSFSSDFLLPKNVENIDANDTNNVLLAPDYVNDIYSYLRHLETVQYVREGFLRQQKEMTARMRSILIDWIINVHNQFKLLPETLYMAVSIMDRYFQCENVNKDKIQLVGVTACWIASKFEEIYPPDLQDFVVICDSLYSRRDIVRCEMRVLKVLQFELGRPLPLHFLRRNSKAAHADSRIHTMAKYLMEVTLIEYACAHWKPSLLAATALYLSLKLLSPDTKWGPTLVHYSGYSAESLTPYVCQLAKVVRGAASSKFQNCNKKYAAIKLMSISKAPELEKSIIGELAAKVSSSP